MDIEQLKLILETLNAAGEGTKDLALIFFVWLFAKSIGAGLLLAGAIVAIYKTAARIIGVTLLETEAAKVLGYYTPLAKHERDEIIRVLKRGNECGGHEKR